MLAFHDTRTRTTRCTYTSTAATDKLTIGIISGLAIGFMFCVASWFARHNTTLTAWTKNGPRPERFNLDNFAAIACESRLYVRRVHAHAHTLDEYALAHARTLLFSSSLPRRIDPPRGTSALRCLITGQPPPHPPCTIAANLPPSPCICSPRSPSIYSLPGAYCAPPLACPAV